MIYISYLVIFFGLINLSRMALFLIGSDLYGLKKHFRRRKKIKNLQTISVIIPAYNEEKSVLNCIKSALNSSYPKNLFQIIIVDDGSTDNTLQTVKNYLNTKKFEHVMVISQANSGKARALNNAAKNYATGELVMCLDADSFIDKKALENVVSYFQNPAVAAVASNVKITKTKGLLNLLQMFEYIICLQMKKAHTVYNIEYIIGGIGSVIRRKLLEKINYFDENTVTEDIDITMKILRLGNRNVRVIYASDVITYTQSALTLTDLIRQRSRWKWGRYQTFLKNKNMFFSKDLRYSKGLSWIYLPYALYSDVAFFFEPIVLTYLLYIIYTYHDLPTFFSSILVITFYMNMNVLSEDTLILADKIKMMLLSPFMYFFFYILSFVEYVALLKSLKRLPRLQQSITENKCNWTPIRKLGTAL